MGKRTLQAAAGLAGLSLIAGGLGLVGGIGASVVAGTPQAGAATSGTTPGFTLKCTTVPVVSTLTLPTTKASASLTPSPATAGGAVEIGDLNIHVTVAKTLAGLIAGKTLGVTVKATGAVSGGTPATVALAFSGKVTVPAKATIPSTGVEATLPGTATPASITAGTASSLAFGLEASSSTAVGITLAGTAVGPFKCSNPAETIVTDSVAAPATRVTSVLPSSGPLSGGEPVSIKGHFLKGESTTAPAVYFGTAEVPANEVDAVSTTQVNVVSPAHAAGTVRVRVHSKLGTSPTTSADDYTYTNAPVVTAVTPASGPKAGGTKVTITGLQLAGATNVHFGTVAAVSFAQVSATSITAVSPPDKAGTVDVTVTNAKGTSIPSALDDFTYRSNGYWMTASDGGIFAFGTAAFYGSMGGTHLDAPVVAIASTPTGSGYWEAAATGGVFTFGSAKFHGSMGGTHLDAPVVGMAADPATGGYWLVTADGGVFAFTAPFDGSMIRRHLDKPIVGIAAAPTGMGYWLVAADGGVFALGTVPFYGSMGGMNLNAPIVGMAAAPTGNGYWLVASTGGVFTFGSIDFYGSMGGVRLAAPVVGISAA